MLLPNNKQKTKLFQYANTARFAYNWALGREQENYKMVESLYLMEIYEKSLHN